MDSTSVLKKFGRSRILVVGDLMLDRYIWGRVKRISPEAPVPVVEVTGDTYSPGGAANVACNIAALGGQATVVGILGKDRQAGVLRGLLADKGVNLIAVEDERPTTVKTRVIAHSQQVVRFDMEDREKAGGSALRGILRGVEEALPGHDAVVVSDYKKGVVSTDVLKIFNRAARHGRPGQTGRGGIFVAVDPKVGHFHLYRGLSAITPNLAEASAGSGMEIKDEKTLVRAGTRLLKRLALKAVLITRGEDGMSLFLKEGVTHIPTLAKKVYDVTGAGDTVIAAFTLAYAAGASLEEAALVANHAAGIVVAEVGTAAATQARLRQSLKRR